MENNTRILFIGNFFFFFLLPVGVDIQIKEDLQEEPTHNHGGKRSLLGAWGCWCPQRMHIKEVYNPERNGMIGSRRRLNWFWFPESGQGEELLRCSAVDDEDEDDQDR